MKVSHIIKFQGGRQYEMHELHLEVSDEDFTDGSLEGLSVSKKSAVMTSSVMQQGIMFQVASGYMSAEDARVALQSAIQLREAAFRNSSKPEAKNE